jgi:hypothetical protein
VVPGAPERDQIPRLQQFRLGHPDVIIGPGEFGTWQATIPEPNGETIIVRYLLRELLDKLDEICALPQPDGGPG